MSSSLEVEWFCHEVGSWGRPQPVTHLCPNPGASCMTLPLSHDELLDRGVPPQPGWRESSFALRAYLTAQNSAWPTRSSTKTMKGPWRSQRGHVPWAQPTHSLAGVSPSTALCARSVAEPMARGSTSGCSVSCDVSLVHTVKSDILPNLRKPSHCPCRVRTGWHDQKFHTVAALSMVTNCQLFTNNSTIWGFLLTLSTWEY